MRIPSAKTLSDRLKLNADEAKELRERLIHRVGDLPDVGPNRAEFILDDFNPILMGYGVEFIPQGHNQRSPWIVYVNKGDTYENTLMFVGGKLAVGSWGDIVERGNYD